MSWIRTINYQEAKGPLKKLYDRIRGSNKTIDNVLTIHSLRPHTLSGHMALYKSVLHHSGNTLPKWYLEALGVFTSHLNNCTYCFEHHLAGLSRLWKDDKKTQSFKDAVARDNIKTFFKPKWKTGFQYAKNLTLHPQKLNKQDIAPLRNVGFTDGEILEINQVVSYFNYVNRSVVGLGVHLKGDVLGLSPNDSDDPNNWNHS